MSYRKLCTALTLATGLCATFPTFAADGDLPDAVNRILPMLQEWGSNPILVEAVREQNALARPLDEIKRLDAEWMAASGVTPFMEGMMNNVPAQELKRLEQTKPYFLEVFLMDGQGANVAMTNKTSDYWQGDEEKFTYSFKDGQGALHIGEVKFDESAQVYLVQVSVPVLDGGSAIGAMTIGIDLDQLGESNQ
ncbi:PDC sensor domain-containing protein [Thiocystis violascens]|uniref:Uncharacterized protein n=1 Tax=Thiocystis violascens (strain ATCC 17096 / DSM 198 / 6111) TaxID=765911 RepID=I3Y668_THIV6|nr:PDC sensor domain-containing protein [Thiocystis violascens]AFL72486.1 hypothetical protein Thivi_0417 [Thiocystis violascens DSM 198]